MTNGQFTLDGDLAIGGEKPKTLIQKRVQHYRKADGYRRCGNCTRFYVKRLHAKTYYKCEVVGFSASMATDIRKNHVCDLWEVVA